MENKIIRIIPESLLMLKAALEEGKRDEAKKSDDIRNSTNKRNNRTDNYGMSQPAPKKQTPINISVKTDDANIKAPAQSVSEQNKMIAAPQTKKNESKPIPLSRNERVKTALIWLYETFPNLFKRQDRLPLKIGITHDVTVWIDAEILRQKQSESCDETTSQANEPKIEAYIPSKKSIRDAITVYTNTPYYQKALLENDKRYDLDGNEVGSVEEKQKLHANQRHTLITAAIQVHTEKREALQERRKMIAETWRAEKNAKKEDQKTV
ncbi:MAG: ProQ/FinO family protein [Pseudomonadota bacterium]